MFTRLISDYSVEPIYRSGLDVSCVGRQATLVPLVSKDSLKYREICQPICAGWATASLQTCLHKESLQIEQSLRKRCPRRSWCNNQTQPSPTNHFNTSTLNYRAFTNQIDYCRWYDLFCNCLQGSYFYVTFSRRSSSHSGVGAHL